jgi:hypothetical protein
MAREHVQDAWRDVFMRAVVETQRDSAHSISPLMSAVGGQAWGRRWG